MSLSPFDSFQSRFVTYLLNFPRMFSICQKSFEQQNVLCRKIKFLSNPKWISSNLWRTFWHLSYGPVSSSWSKKCFRLL